MPRNQPNTKTPATAPRVAKPRTPRVTASKHSRAVAAEEVIVMVKDTAHEEEVKEIISSLTELPAEPSSAAATAEADPLDTISKLAYGYWEKRGGVGGDPLSDWVQAEHEYRRLIAA